MAKVNLNRKWFHRGEWYGPGEVEVPDSLVNSLRKFEGATVTTVTHPTEELPENAPVEEILVEILEEDA